MEDHPVLISLLCQAIDRLALLSQNNKKAESGTVCTTAQPPPDFGSRGTDVPAKYYSAGVYY